MEQVEMGEDYHDDGARGDAESSAEDEEESVDTIEHNSCYGYEQRSKQLARTGWIRGSDGQIIRTHATEDIESRTRGRNNEGTSEEEESADRMSELSEDDDNYESPTVTDGDHQTSPLEHAEDYIEKHLVRLEKRAPTSPSILVERL